MTNKIESNVQKIQNLRLHQLAAQEVENAAKTGGMVEVSKVGHDVTVKVLPPIAEDKLPDTN